MWRLHWKKSKLYCNVHSVRLLVSALAYLSSGHTNKRPESVRMLIAALSYLLAAIPPLPRHITDILCTLTVSVQQNPFNQNYYKVVLSAYHQ